MSNSNTESIGLAKPATSGASDIALRYSAPSYDWQQMSETEHFVQFYEGDEFLLNALGGFVGKALTSSDAAVVIATEEHRNGLDRLLATAGVDVAAARTTGKYVVLDAAETLAKFMVGNAPEPQRFLEVVGNVVARVADGRARVRAFGEMVALLWSAGNYAGAIKLEELWNDLQRTHSFSLFCAYPMNALGGENLGDHYNSVCNVHGRVIPAESYSGLIDHDARLRAIALLQQRSEMLEAEVTRRQQIEERLRLALLGEQMARAEAETANRMKDEFLATVSHEIRTPLNAIIGWSHLLRAGRLDEATAARAIETIDRNAKSQAQLIEDILDASRMITGKLRLKNEVVDIASVINAAIDSVQLAIDSKDLHLEVTLDPSGRHTVGDSNRLQQVVWNLLSNAIKFTPAGGRIKVSVKRSAGNLQLCVADSGNGISRDFLPFIFERFRQADGTTTRQHGGLGLGLAIARHLIELHGGTIKAESDGIGKGATFTIGLPLAPRKNTRRKKVVPLERDVRISNAPVLEGVKVLLVDDDPDTLQILRVMLGESKATVETASSAGEALEKIEWFRPHALVSDLAMPGEDGYSLIKKLKALGSADAYDIPAIALTSYVQGEDRARALAAGFNMFVPKPVEPEELATAIANLVEADNESS